MKICTKCNIKKELSYFYKDKNGRDGVRSTCKKCEIKRRTLFMAVNKVSHNRYRRYHYATNRDKILNNQREYMNGGKGAAYSKAYRDRLGDEYKIRIRKYDKQRRNTDQLYKLRRTVSNLIHSAMKRKYTKNTKTLDMIGCSWVFLRKYLESQFQQGMTWDNYGEWHIDHIKPCASAKNQKELIILQHYTNLQPLWAGDNLSKGAKY